MSKPLKFFGIFILLAVIFIAGFFILRDDADIWVCENGKWIKRGNPASPMPQTPCELTIEEPQDVILETPQFNDVLVSPLEIRGKARGGWFFEAEFPVKLVDNKGELISIAIARSQGEWMTNDLVDFTSSLSFLVSTTTRAVLILQRNNPSDLRELDKQIEIPVILKPSETMSLNVFFGNTELSDGLDCNVVFPVERKIFKTLTPAQAIIEDLLKGPSAGEKALGYFSAIPNNVGLNEINIDKQGKASIDFSEELQNYGGGSCNVAAISAQITQTLRQFSSVKEVVISVNGRTEDILQP